MQSNNKIMHYIPSVIGAMMLKSEEKNLQISNSWLMLES